MCVEVIVKGYRWLCSNNLFVFIILVEINSITLFENQTPLETQELTFV